MTKETIRYPDSVSGEIEDLANASNVSKSELFRFIAEDFLYHHNNYEPSDEYWSTRSQLGVETEGVSSSEEMSYLEIIYNIAEGDQRPDAKMNSISAIAERVLEDED